MRERVREIVKWQPEEEDFLSARDAAAAAAEDEDEDDEEEDVCCGSGSTCSHRFPNDLLPCYLSRF